METTSRPRLRSDLVVEEVDGETVVLDPRDGTIHLLNTTGTMVVWRCDGRRPVAGIARELSEARPATDFDRVVEEVLAFLRVLEGRRLLALDESIGCG